MVILLEAPALNDDLLLMDTLLVEQFRPPMGRWRSGISAEEVTGRIARDGGATEARRGNGLRPENGARLFHGRATCLVTNESRSCVVVRHLDNPYSKIPQQELDEENM
jgi:hypothetical protein